MVLFPLFVVLGGLVNTVFDRDNDNVPSSPRTPMAMCSIKPISMHWSRPWNGPLVSGISSPKSSRNSLLSGMACDYSWNNPGDLYVGVYEHIRHK